MDACEGSSAQGRPPLGHLSAEAPRWLCGHRACSATRQDWSGARSDSSFIEFVDSHRMLLGTPTEPVASVIIQLHVPPQAAVPRNPNRLPPTLSRACTDKSPWAIRNRKPACAPLPGCAPRHEALATQGCAWGHRRAEEKAAQG